MYRRIKDSIKVLLGAANVMPVKTITSSENAKTCVVCQKTVSKFKPLDKNYINNLAKHNFIHSLFQFETLNVTEYACPNCGASDRERLYALFFEKYGKFQNNKEYKLLDFAPSKALSNYILNKYPLIGYRSADLYMPNVDDIVDITEMHCYEENKFDFIICSHVLEHVTSDLKAMHELYRIMKKGGFGIIMAPILLSIIEDYENINYRTEEERWQHFGQDDHLRIYSKAGFLNKLNLVGFKIHQYSINNWTKEIFENNGINDKSILYIVEK